MSIILGWCASGTVGPPYLNPGHALSVRPASLWHQPALWLLSLQGTEQTSEPGAQQMGDARSQDTRALSKRHRASPSGQ